MISTGGLVTLLFMSCLISQVIVSIIAGIEGSNKARGGITICCLISVVLLAVLFLIGVDLLIE